MTFRFLVNPKTGRRYKNYVINEYGDLLNLKTLKWRTPSVSTTSQYPKHVIHDNGKAVIFAVHQWLWASFNEATIPDGYQIHHVNFDHTDDYIDNLVCLSRAEHMRVHREHRKNEVVNNAKF